MNLYTSLAILLLAATICSGQPAEAPRSAPTVTIGPMVALDLNIAFGLGAGLQAAFFDGLVGIDATVGTFLTRGEQGTTCFASGA